ncbi:substrate-binding domain-containing protein [Telmatospirillum siberiense]|uniref:Quinoprotein dehydrogenase-associated putative ABC transporter substrate-binding protein n=1 Tax=Telmatospirillum siberiense TaxID=382514 RepID=A0A2N3PMC8_9PROT|nr:substrate-binding domain-containing protein [Telmatospirillum siberiense]PKU21558.1 quinoprotein dehydrogenase-associated putative ABC transporter substrate-binding protein [Telmatospirillum siberiense]
MRRARRAGWLPTVFAAALLLALGGGRQAAVAQSPTGDLVARTSLRVCADPSDLPFSNEKGEGFENKIAELLGREMSLPVEYVWYPQVIGFLRNTLWAGRCDLVMGTVAGDGELDTTNPYYYTSYVLVFRNDVDPPFSGLDDPRLKELRIGVISGTPPADLVLRHGLMGRARPYPLTVDTRVDAPSRRMIEDVAARSIDAGVLWGPLAGYYIRREKLPLGVALLKGEPSAPRMDYHIAMGVRHNEPDWRRKINGLIRSKQGEINQILLDYGVPLLDEQGGTLVSR